MDFFVDIIRAEKVKQRNNKRLADGQKKLQMKNQWNGFKLSYEEHW